MEENRRRELPEFISVISSSQCARIRIDDIEAIEQEGRKLHIITAARDYSFYENMKNIIPSLAERAFYRPMKGLIINFDHVREISGCYIIFYSGQSVSMGKNSICRARQAYKRYLMKYPPYSLWEPDKGSRMEKADKVAENVTKNDRKYVEINKKKI